MQAYGTFLPVVLPPPSQSCEAAAAAAAVDAVAAPAVVDSVSAGPASAWSDAHHPGPTNCAVSYTHRGNDCITLTMLQYWSHNIYHAHLLRLSCQLWSKVYVVLVLFYNLVVNIKPYLISPPCACI